MPRFTVLMPVWNREAYVRQAIRSILDQTFLDFELLIIDDGSTDKTRIVLDGPMDKRVRVIHKRHTGLADSLRFGNDEAKGEIIVKQDADDLSLPNRLEAIDKYMANADFLIHGMYRSWEMDEGLISRSYFPALPIDTDRLLTEQYLPGCFAYTKKFIAEHPYRDLNVSEDWMLLLDAALSKVKFLILNEGLYDYIPRDDSHSFISEDTGRYEEDEEKMKQWLREDYGIKDFKYVARP